MKEERSRPSRRVTVTRYPPAAEADKHELEYRQ
jgi:hypothetical protein